MEQVQNQTQTNDSVENAQHTEFSTTMDSVSMSADNNDINSKEHEQAIDHVKQELHNGNCSTEHKAEYQSYEKKIKWLSYGFILLICLTIAGWAALFVFCQNSVQALSTQLAETKAAAQNSADNSVEGTVWKSSQSDEIPVYEIYENAMPQIVSIKVVKPNEEPQHSADVSVEITADGSGFFITQDGYIATNYHIVKDSIGYNYPIQVILPGEVAVDASVVGCDTAQDIAVLKIDGEGYSVPKMGNIDTLRVGDKVYAVGTALGKLYYSLSSGCVSAVNRIINPAGIANMNAIQLDIAVNEGNSGGPVYNAQGEVVGIVLAKFTSLGAEGLAFMIPINEAESTWSHILLQNGVGY